MSEWVKYHLQQIKFLPFRAEIRKNHKIHVWQFSHFMIKVAVHRKNKFPFLFKKEVGISSSRDERVSIRGWDNVEHSLPFGGMERRSRKYLLPALHNAGFYSDLLDVDVDVDNNSCYGVNSPSYLSL